MLSGSFLDTCPLKSVAEGNHCKVICDIICDVIYERPSLLFVWTYLFKAKEFKTNSIILFLSGFTWILNLDSPGCTPSV